VPDGTDAVPTIVQTLTANGIDTKRVQLLGTGLWEDAQIFSNPLLDGAWYAGPDSTGFRNFSARYRSRYGKDPVRTASLAYDAVALVAALVKTQGRQRFSDDVLTNSSGFTASTAVPLPARTARTSADLRCCGCRRRVVRSSARHPRVSGARRPSLTRRDRQSPRQAGEAGQRQTQSTLRRSLKRALARAGARRGAPRAAGRRDAS
jgi:hypothetical protein